jgi:hypothetical protein
MMQISEISTESLIITLRALVVDLTNKNSPFNKDENYLHNLSGWIACAATRLEQLQSKGSGNGK